MNLSEEQRDLLTELINIGVGRGASSLNQMLGTHISLSVPTIQVLDTTSSEMQTLLNAYSKQSSVHMSFSGGFLGSSLLTFSPESAMILVNSILEAELGDSLADDDMEDEIDSLQASALVEVGNIVINGVLGSLSNGLGVHLQYTVPSYEEASLESFLRQSNEENIQLLILAKTLFKSQSLDLTGEIFLLLELSSLHEFVSLLDRQTEALLSESSV